MIIILNEKELDFNEFLFFFFYGDPEFFNSTILRVTYCVDFVESVHNDSPIRSFL